MRILWITPGFAAGPQDHNCIPPLQALARALAGIGVELHIIALEYPFIEVPYGFYPTPIPSPRGEEGPFPTFSLPPAEKNNNSPNQAPLPPGGGDGGGAVYPCNGRNRRWLRWRSRARARAYAQAILRENKFDALHSFWLGPAWALGEEFAATYNLPHWTTLMGQDALPRNRYLRRLKPVSAARMITLTPFHRDALERSTGLYAAHCIPWGLEAGDAQAAGSAARPVDILGAGSLIPVKDWARWLSVLRRVAGTKPGVQAQLIGAGPELRRLKALASDAGLGGLLQFTGDLPRPELLARMRQSRVLLHTARFESFGMVLAEAAANGCRVVSTPVGAAPELGVCHDDDAALAAAVLQALEAPVHHSARVLFRIGQTAAEYLNLYAGAGR